MNATVVSAPRDGGGADFGLAVMAGALWLGSVAGHHSGRLTFLALPVGYQIGVLVALAVAAGASVLDAGLRRILLISAVSVVVGFGLGIRADQVYEEVAPGAVDSRADVVADPVRRGGGTWLVLRLDGGTRVEAGAFGPVGHRLSRISFGDTVKVVGNVRPIGERAWLKSRHIEGTLTVESFDRISGPPWYMAPASEVRSLIAEGAEHLPEGLRPLYSGLVTGDDRAQGVGRRAVFRAAGLGHLVAVSGQNVAFVLAVAGPATRSLPRRLRLAFVLTVLVVFLVITRMEPSVLRAVSCAAISTWAALSGRERSGVSVLAAACAGLLVLDPFLAVVVGFQLSVVASLGILAITPVLVERIPGPSLVVQPLSVTLGAQLAVSPLLVMYFDAIPLVALPANLLVGWAAGLVMMLGLSAGIISAVLTRLADDLIVGTAPAAGLPQIDSASVVVGRISTLLADWLQLPTEILLRWIDWAARQAVLLPLPIVGRVPALVITLLAVAWMVRPRSGRIVKSLESITLAAVLALAVLTTPTSPDSAAELEPGCLWLADIETLIVYQPCGPGLVDAVIAARIRSVQLVVVEGGGSHVATVDALRQVSTVRAVLAPPLHNVVGARRVAEPIEVELSTCMLGLSDGGTGCGELVLQLRPTYDRRHLIIDLCGSIEGSRAEGCS